MDSLKEALIQALKRANIVLKEPKKEEPKKVFCGPNKTYLSTNCEETKDSMKKISKAKMDGRMKGRIMKCLYQRLRLLKCKE